MANRHVEPSKDGWRVIKEGGARASATTATRDEALERARQIIANDGGGELIIHADGGNIVDRERVEAAGRERSETAETAETAETTDTTETTGGAGGISGTRTSEFGEDRDEPPRRLQDEVEDKILDVGRVAATTAKQWADQGRDVAKGVIGKVRGRIGR